MIKKIQWYWLLKISNYIKNIIPLFYYLLHDLFKNSYNSSKNISFGMLNRILFSNLENYDIPSKVIDHYIKHEFDILGSGWKELKYGIECQGFKKYRYTYKNVINIDQKGEWLKKLLNRPNITTAQSIFRLVDKTYKPIDWQIDFKSGYRWKEKTWYKFIKKGHLPGVDIKVPWELSRSQHLPQIAYAFSSKDSHYYKNIKLVNEYRNQILDFISTNPPRFGLNWLCTMEVAIRATNWLLAFDMFMQAGAIFDDEFKKVLFKSIYDHGYHIIRNLEWYNRIRGNHYLANISGLAFISAYLPSIEETDYWLAFSIQELISEIKYQFYEDGGHFEGSVAYHCFAAEMVYYATSLIIGLPEERFNKLKKLNKNKYKRLYKYAKLNKLPIKFYKLPTGSSSNLNYCPFPQWYFEKMEKMSELIVDVTKPLSNHFTQIGDNDSGSFVKILPKYYRLTVTQAKCFFRNLREYNRVDNDNYYYAEDNLDSSQLLFDMRSFFNSHFNVNKNSIIDGQVTSILNILSKSRIIGAQRNIKRNLINDKREQKGDIKKLREILFYIKKTYKNNHIIKDYYCRKDDLSQNLYISEFPDFGIYIYRSENLYLCVRCNTTINNIRTGHMHEDQLSIELVIDNKEKIVDPGTYIYTPLPEERNKYRKAENHFSPITCNLDLKDKPKNIFSPININGAEIIIKNHYGFYAKLCNVEGLIGLLLIIENKRIRICFVNSNIPLYSNCTNSSINISPGYGLKINKLSLEEN